MDRAAMSLAEPRPNHFYRRESVNVQDIRLLVDYTDWANHLVLDAVDAISLDEQQRERGVSHGSLHGTLLHMLFAEWVWLSRWKGSSPTAALASADFPTLEEIREYWKAIENERQGFVAGLSDEALLSPLTYRDMKGTEYTNPLGLLMQHVVNHATLHRGQVMGMIRQLGIKPPETDFLFFFRK